jgi:hypothetical protein
MSIRLRARDWRASAGVPCEAATITFDRGAGLT